VKVLLLGGSGRLGRALFHALSGHAVSAPARATADLADPDSVRRTIGALRPDLVLNAAGWTDVDGAEGDPDGARRANSDGPGALAEACSASSVGLVHVSTDHVFDGAAHRPYVESDPTGPVNVYGATKLAGERAVLAAHPGALVVRTAWLYGAEGPCFPRTILDAARGGGPLRVVDDQWGSPTWAPHLAAGLLRLAEQGARGLRHLAGSGGTSRCAWARALVEAAGLRVEVIPVTTEAVPRPARRPRYAVLDTERTPRVELPPWEEGLRAFARGL